MSSPDSKDILALKSRIRWGPFLAFSMREVHRFSKVFFQTIIIPIMHSALYLVIFGVSLGGTLNFQQGFSYLEFIIPGLVMMSCLSNAFQNGSGSILSLKFGGDIVDIKASPLTFQQILWALAFGGVCRGMLVGGLVLVIGEIFHFYYQKSWLWPVSPAYLIFFFIIAGMVFSKLGAVVALWAKTFDHIGAIGGLVITPLTYLGGVFFPLDILSPFWKTVSLFNPVFYFINGIRWSILGHSDVSIGICVAVSVLSLIFFHAVCLLTMKYASYNRW